MAQNRIVIAGTNSGCGKTTISIGIMAALKRRGLLVQPFKVGPDYIDPMFHTRISGRNGRNLDSWLLDNDTVKYLFCKNSKKADISVIEGVMGMFDGYGNSSKGSTADVAKILGAPVILVLNAKGLSMSAAAIVTGFQKFDSDVNVKGLILNHIKTEYQYRLLKEVIEQNTSVEVLGYLKEEALFHLESRHLGLVAEGELVKFEKQIDVLADEILKTVEIDKLVKIAGMANEIKSRNIWNTKSFFDGEGIKIGVAYDKAFNFYYKDNLELLADMGAELKYFSPIKDKKLPEGLSGLYIGGGYPEVFGSELEQNSVMRQSIKNTVDNGMVVYAECGGLIYMTESITDNKQNTYDMTGAFRGQCSMGNRLNHFGYVEMELKNDCIIGKKGLRIKAHEFHYSRENMKCKGNIKVVKKNSRWETGYCYNNLLAVYPHIHFWSNIVVAENYLRSCKGEKLC